MSDPFLKIMEGRVPKPTVLGSAATVVGEGQPLRPDRSYEKLKWISLFGGILGIDHLYLRNPYSAALKGFTLGGFLIWWLWDVIQIWTEKERVILYGLSAPFDLKTGFGQGTIAEDKTNYEQRSDSAWWLFAALFSFAGADSMLLGNWAQMLRKLTELVILAMFVIPLFYTWMEEGIHGILSITNIFKVLCAALIGFIVLSEWVNVVSPTFGDPVEMYKRGIRISKNQDDILNFPRAWVENITIFGPEIQRQIMQDIGYRSVPAHEIQQNFEVRHVTSDEKEAEARAEEAAAAAKAAADAAKPIRWNWLLSYLVYLFGPFIVLFQLIMKGIRTAYYALFPGALIAEGISKKAQEAAAATVAGNGLLNPLQGVDSVSKGLDHLTRAGAHLLPTSGTAAANHDPTNVGRNLDEDDPKPMKGGARNEAPTGQGMILGASVLALAGGAAIKLAVDYLLPA